MSVQSFATTVSEEAKKSAQLKVAELRLNSEQLKYRGDYNVQDGHLIDGMMFEDMKAKWMERTGYVQPDKLKLEQAYDESQRNALGDLKLLESHRSKRKSSYMKKAGMQVSACELYKLQKDTREVAVDAFCDEMSEEEFLATDVRFLQDWCAYYHEGEKSGGSGFTDLKKLVSNDEQEKKEEARKMADRLMTMDLSVFEYKDDATFLQKFREQYVTVCAFSNFQKIIDLLDEGENEEEINRLRIRVSVMADIRADYENRLQIMQSPYYALLLERDTFDREFETVKDGNSNQADQAYFRAVEKKLSLRFGSGASAKELEQRYVRGDFMDLTSEEKTLDELELEFAEELAQKKEEERQAIQAERRAAFKKEHDRKLQERKNEHETFDSRVDIFTDRYAREESGEEETAENKLSAEIQSFRDKIRTQIPGDPTAAQNGMQEMFVAYAVLISAFEGYIGQLEKADSLTEDEKEKLELAKELYLGYQDEQQVFLEAVALFEKKGFEGVTGSWEDVLYTVDAKSVLKPATAEFSEYARAHFKMLDTQNELILDQEEEDTAPTQMSEVRRTIGKLNEKLFAPVQKGTGFEEAKKSILDAYQAVIDSCVALRDVISLNEADKKTNAGARRLLQLKQIIDQCTLEKDAMGLLSENELVGQEIKLKPGMSGYAASYTAVWNDLLYGIRAVKISVDAPNVSIVGAGSSTLYRVQHDDGSTAYVKRSEACVTISGSEAAKDAAKMYAAGDDAHAAEIGRAILELCKDTKVTEDLDKLREQVYRISRIKYERKTGQSASEFKEFCKAQRRAQLKAHIDGEKKNYSGALSKFIDDHMEDFIDFMYFLDKKDTEYYNAVSVARAESGAEISSRNTSTSRLAASLGISDIVAESKTAVLVEKD
ncbi:MAG: hypothetical protein K6B14_04235, partial [Lachnospiraceae bacterium]|nr:hypothetical protein [Lachnospiraceae bacterium]